MASVYQKQFTIPQDFPMLLKNFTREVLRSQPEDIYAFGASYFSELAADQVKERAENAPLRTATLAEMQPYLLELFLQVRAETL